MSAPRNFISIPHIELSQPSTTRYRVTLDLTLEDDPTQWDWEDLLEIEDLEKVNNVTFEEFPVVGTRLSLDFYNANKRVAVEVQGSQHTKYNKFFHGGHKNNYLEQLKRDQIKAEFCEVNDIILVEIYDSDIINKSLFKKFDVTL